MRHDDDDYYADYSTTPAPSQRATAAVAPVEVVDDIQRKLCRDQMMGMWRAAVDGAAQAVRAEHERRAAEDEPTPTSWMQGRAAA